MSGSVPYAMVDALAGAVHQSDGGSNAAEQPDDARVDLVRNAGQPGRDERMTLVSP
ncbi:hypothetical protein JQ614_08255 [Bradyrhizobium diazoefficiens]|uniref:hypothetical protein n=1 Tax=Bradyrhizobium diazoefficiens TaxID=1355477 RepID=UPI001B8BBBF9|nr:hypothetical protein [Bradyrhizobium diazoefficiens]MBR0886313.1 hypothetical protein [Bradyrhizobium diazoefficiens]MBR0918127.1 hypothetical protein [Bradyrhizobium diazoefficiens]